eukprot:scaffold118147_cov16-Tisochrysis_lutea.AAC.1
MVADIGITAGWHTTVTVVQVADARLAQHLYKCGTDSCIAGSSVCRADAGTDGCVLVQSLDLQTAMHAAPWTTWLPLRGRLAVLDGWVGEAQSRARCNGPGASCPF